MAEVTQAAQHGLLRNRGFMALWAAQILSQTAANAVTSALIVLVAELTHNNTSSSFLILLAIIPAVLFGFAGGVIVDRVDRRIVLIVTNSARVRTLPIGLATMILTEGAHGTQWNQVMAADVFVIAPILVAFVFFQRHLSPTALTSGVK